MFCCRMPVIWENILCLDLEKGGVFACLLALGRLQERSLRARGGVATMPWCRNDKLWLHLFLGNPVLDFLHVEVSFNYQRHFGVGSLEFLYRFYRSV